MVTICYVYILCINNLSIQNSTFLFADASIAIFISTEEDFYRNFFMKRQSCSFKELSVLVLDSRWNNY